MKAGAYAAFFTHRTRPRNMRHNGAMNDSLRLWFRLVPAYATGYFLSYGLRSVNAVIAPELMQELGMSAAGLGMLTSAYFLAFGLFQLPLGLLLDRFGPRRVEAALLLVAAAGCVLFALGTSLQALAVARALIGLGVSACLMASFKAYSQWFPTERQASLTATTMVAGGLGALTASVPVEALLPLLGWRGVFFLVAALLVATAGLLMTVPDKTAGTAPESLMQQLRTLGGIYGNRTFWRFAPQGSLTVGGYMAIQGLWAVPWLIEVDGLTRTDAASVLLLLSLAMLVGFLFVATGSVWLARRGITPAMLLTGGMGLALGGRTCHYSGPGTAELALATVGPFIQFGQHCLFPVDGVLSGVAFRAREYGTEPAGFCGCLCAAVGHRRDGGCHCEHGHDTSRCLSHDVFSLAGGTGASFCLVFGAGQALRLFAMFAPIAIDMRHLVKKLQAYQYFPAPS
jgi:MFS family permease